MADGGRDQFGATGRGYLDRAEEGFGVGPQRIAPPFFRAFFGLIEVGPVPAVTRAEPDRLPVAGFVTGAGVGFRSGEGLGQQRRVAEVLLPELGEDAQGRRQRLRGQVGRLPFGGEQEEAAVLHDQLEPLDPLRSAPRYPAVAILERVTGRSPDQQGPGLAVLLDHLAQGITHRVAGPRRVMLGQLAIEPLDLCVRGAAHRERGTSRGGRSLRTSCFQPS